MGSVQKRENIVQTEVKNFIKDALTRLNMLRRFLNFQGKAWRYCVRLLKKNRASDVAASLSFSTIFGLVPLAVVVLLVFQFMPGYEDIGDRIKNYAYDQLYLSAIEYAPKTPHDVEEEVETEIDDHTDEEMAPEDVQESPKEQLTDHLDRIIQTMIDSIDTGGVTVISLIFVIIAALVLLFKIERAFNNIYHVTFRRNFLQRMVNYWAVMTLGPVLIGTGMYVMTQHIGGGDIEAGLYMHMGGTVVSYLIAVVTLFMLYFVLPNTSVQISAAVWGAAVAGVAWMASKWLFGLYITNFLPYRDIYGAIGLIPLGVIWIYVTWLIVLFGLQLTFTMQHLRTLDRADVEAAKEGGRYFLANHMTVVGIVREVAEWFDNKRGAVGIEYICSKLDLPADFGEHLAGLLVQAGILAKVSEPRDGYMLGGQPEDIQLSDIADVLDKAGFGRQAVSNDDRLMQISQSQRAVLDDLTVRDILGDNDFLEEE